MGELMTYIQNGNLWLPCAPTIDPILLFVDESYFVNNSGFVQACVAVPRDTYQNNIVPQCKLLLSQLGPNAKEFKGNKIKQGNASIYEAFLKLFINAMAGLSDISKMNSIVTVDAQGPYSGRNVTWINRNVDGAMQRLGIQGTTHLATEFSKQILWLYHHWPKLCGRKYHNPLIVFFDEKHNYAQQCQQMQFVSAPGTPAILQSTNRTLTSFANSLFGQMEPKRDVSKIIDFTFSRSDNEFGLQAADLLAHLMLNSLRTALGSATPNMKLREGMLQVFMPGHCTPQALIQSLQLQGSDIKCINSSLLSTFRLEPAN